MKRAMILVIVGAVILAGCLWWGIPSGRLKTELQDVRASADRLSPQLDDLQKRDRDLAAELKAQKARLATTEQDLRAEQEMNSRLHLLVSQGQK
jgi:outer membrane murein-binding lipoprotein Lpp